MCVRGDCNLEILYFASDSNRPFELSLTKHLFRLNFNRTLFILQVYKALILKSFIFSSFPVIILTVIPTLPLTLPYNK